VLSGAAGAVRADISGWGPLYADCTYEEFTSNSDQQCEFDTFEMFAGAESFNADSNLARSRTRPHPPTRRPADRKADSLALLAVSGWNDRFTTSGAILTIDREAPGFRGDPHSMLGLFSRARSFNADIGAWDVSRMVNLVGTFDEAESFNAGA
jgi:hypothetical protein